MSNTGNQQYLENRIKTASSAQLHLMLIEGAIRFARQAERGYEANDVETASPHLLRAMDIVSEMLAGVKHSDSDINVKLAELYRFMFTRLTMAYVNTDRAMLAEAINLLEFERETWQLAVERSSAEKTPEQKGLKGPHAPVSLESANVPMGGLSLEA